MSAGSEQIESQARAIAERVAASEDLELVEVEWHGSGRRGVLRVFIDKPGGVTHGDCEAVSRQMSMILDVEDVVPDGAYTLEVSSPGLDRKLTKPADYERFQGRKAKIRLDSPVDGRQQFTGVLRGLEGGEVILETGPDAEARIRLEQIRSARLVVEL